MVNRFSAVLVLVDPKKSVSPRLTEIQLRIETAEFQRFIGQAMLPVL